MSIPLFKPRRITSPASTKHVGDRPHDDQPCMACALTWVDDEVAGEEFPSYESARTGRWSGQLGNHGNAVVAVVKRGIHISLHTSMVLVNLAYDRTAMVRQVITKKSSLWISPVYA